MQIKRHTIEAQLNSGIYNFVGRGVRKCDRYETFIIIIIIIIIIIVIILIIVIIIIIIIIIMVWGAGFKPVAY